MKRALDGDPVNMIWALPGIKTRRVHFLAFAADSSATNHSRRRPA
jgi:hypothetical protein